MNKQLKNEQHDVLGLAKSLKANDLRFNYTTLDSYFQSSIVPDNQKVLIALLVLRKQFRNKPLMVSNSFIAEFLNRKGILVETFKQVEKYNEISGEFETVDELESSKVIYNTRRVKKDGEEVEEPLYTKSGVSDAIQSWVAEGIIKCEYDYKRNDKHRKDGYAYDTTRTISFNFDELREVLGCFYSRDFISKYYTSLPARSRRRKLVRSRPFSILDNLPQLLCEFTEELKAKYKTAKAIFYDWCYRNAKRYFKTYITNKPDATLTEMEKYLKSQEIELKRALASPVNKISSQQDNPSKNEEKSIIKRAFEMVRTK